MSAPRVPADETAERTGIQVDGYKIKAHLRPVETGEPTHETWAEVAQSVNAKLKSIAVDSVGLVADVVEGSRRIIRGLADIPAAVARRIDRAHEKADRVEALEQVKVESRALPPPSPADAMNYVKEFLLGLQAQGKTVGIRDLEDGRVAIVIVKPEDQQFAAEVVAKALPGPGQPPVKKKRQSRRKQGPE